MTTAQQRDLRRRQILERLQKAGRPQTFRDLLAHVSGKRPEIQEALECLLKQQWITAATHDGVRAFKLTQAGMDKMAAAERAEPTGK